MDLSSMTRRRRLKLTRMRIERPKCVIEDLAVNSPSVVAAEDGADVEVDESSQHPPLQLHPPKRTSRSLPLRRTINRSRTMIIRKKKETFPPKHLKRLTQEWQ